MGLRLERVAELVDGRVHGDPTLEVRGVRALDVAGPDDLSFLSSPRYRRQAEESRAGALLVSEEIPELAASQVVVDDPSAALAVLLAHLHPRRRPAPGVHPAAVVEGAEIDPSAHVGAYAVVGAGSRVAAGAVVHPHAVVGRDCILGRDSELFPGAVLYDRTELGARSVVHAGAVVGSDGFGYVQVEGEHRKVPQVGRAVVEEDVEIGANTTVDRALLEATRIGAGSKIDNLVQVAHNVEIGRRCLLISQAGIAGSTRLGDGVVVAGQAGVVGHVEIGDGVRVAAKSAVFRSVEPGMQVAGIPARDAAEWRREVALIGRLDGLRRRVAALERAAAGRRGGEEPG